MCNLNDVLKPGLQNFRNQLFIACPGDHNMCTHVQNLIFIDVFIDNPGTHVYYILFRSRLITNAYLIN